MDIQHDVCGFDITMDDALFTGISQGITNVHSEFNCLVRRELSPNFVQSFQTVLQRFSWNKLEHHVINSPIVIKIEYLYDIRVTQSGNGCSFLLKTHNELGIGCQARMYQFDRHGTLQIWIVCLINRGHPP